MLTRNDFPFTGSCDVCHYQADLMRRGNRYICYVCSIHEGSLPLPVYGPRIVVTEVVNPCHM